MTVPFRLSGQWVIQPVMDFMVILSTDGMFPTYRMLSTPAPPLVEGLKIAPFLISSPALRPKIVNCHQGSTSPPVVFYQHFLDAIRFNMDQILLSHCQIVQQRLILAIQL